MIYFIYIVCLFCYCTAFERLSRCSFHAHRAVHTPPARHLSMMFVPKDIPFQLHQLELVRILGKIDMSVDKETLDEANDEYRKYQKGVAEGNSASGPYIDWNPLNRSNRMTYVRIYEARLLGGTRCFLKEYLPIGLAFGKREIMTTRKLTTQYNKFVSVLREELDSKGKTEEDIEENTYPSFPVLLGTLRPDERIRSPEFIALWSQRFPRARPPEPDTLWLIFQWNDSTFKTLRKYPALPQIVEGFDYFLRKERDAKRWRFIRKIFRSSLEALNSIHTSGFCHNALSSESLWLSTTNQQEIDNLNVVITDLGTSQALSELGPKGSREGIHEDLYSLGLIFLECVISSFTEDNIGAQTARERLSKRFIAFWPYSCVLMYLFVCQRGRKRSQVAYYIAQKRSISRSFLIANGKKSTKNSVIQIWRAYVRFVNQLRLGKGR